MIRGGIADKLGNGYEAKWVVRCLMDVIDGKASWLNFESIDPEYKGFEFAISYGKETHWHQTKINAPGGNWTIRSLEKAEILKTFFNRLSADRNSHCYLVSQDNAKDFRTLSEKARFSNSFEQFHNEVSKDQLNHFKQVQSVWQQSDDLTFQLLKRCVVNIIPEREIESLINSYGDLYFYDGGKKIFPTLRAILENNFNRKLTTESVREAIKSERTLEIKEWSLDPTIQQSLTEATEAYLDTYTPFGVGGQTISRSQTDVLIDDLLSINGHDLILLTGAAGSGKSGIVRSVIQNLQSENIPHLAFRIDQHLSCETKNELGDQLIGRAESPVSSLKGTFPDRNSVLLIDQVDAISEVAGRDGRVKEVVLQLIKDAVNFEGVKVVVVCRTFDLDSDPRLKRLKKNDRTKQIEVPLLIWEEEVSPLLKNKGFIVSKFKKLQRQILQVPINLAVFLEIDEPDISFRSPFNLYKQLLEKKQTKFLKNRNVSWSLTEPLKKMAEWMSNRQKLSAPEEILDNYPNSIKLLTSESLIVSSRGQINFFHESFFDYIYARTFINIEKSLLTLLLSDEQYLFRRTQVRQILETLRQVDPDRYIRELSDVLLSNDIRFHIKTAICQWLNTVDEPTKEEFEIISNLDDGIEDYNQLFRRAILSHSNWFVFLNKSGWIQKQLESESADKKNAILRWLNTTANDYTSETAQLLRNWWNRSEENGSRILNWFSYIDNPNSPEKLIKLFKDINSTHPASIFKKKFDSIDLILHSWSNVSPENTARVLKVIIESWFNVNSEGVPFSREENFIIRKHSLDTLFKKSPEAFLNGATDGLIKSIDRVVNGSVEDFSKYEFNRRTYSGSTHGFDHFIGLYRSALKQVAKENPKIAANYLDQLDAEMHECLMHIHLEVIQENPQEFGNRLSQLIQFDSVYDAGWNGAKWYSFAHTCKKVIPYLDSTEKKMIELSILNYNPEIDFAQQSLKTISELGEEKSYTKKRNIVPRLLNSSGYRQWCILETIGEELLSVRAKNRLEQLRRKFPNEEVKEPTHRAAGFVQSPISQEHCEKMNDQQWLSAINRYDGNNSRNLSKDFLKGDARELAGQLKVATENDPKRFSALSLRIPYEANNAYLEHILMGLREADSPPSKSLIQIIEYAHHHPDRPFGREITRIIEKHPSIAKNSKILDIILWYALEGDDEEHTNITSDNKSGKITIDSLLKETGTHYFRGINTIRGRAWEALASVLWKLDDKTEIIWTELDRAISVENKISVRCCMMTTLVPLFNADKERFKKSIQDLITLPNIKDSPRDVLQLYPLITRNGIYLFGFIFHWIPDLARVLVNKLLNCGEEKIELIGAYLIYVQSFRKEEYIEEANQLASRDINHRSLLTEVTVDAIKWAGNLDRVERLLKQFFYDDDSQVREQVSKVFHNISDTKNEMIEEIALDFVESPSFTENPSPFIYSLESMIFDVQNLVIEASQKIIEVIKEEKELNAYKGDKDMHKLQDLLKREYSSSETNPIAREKILNLIDQMLLNEIYGAEKIVSTHDRW